MKCYALLLCLSMLAALAAAQPADHCDRFDGIMQRAKALWKEKKFEDAFAKLSAAREACPGKADQVDEQYAAFIRDIAGQYETARLKTIEAQAATRKAEKNEADAKDATRRAEEKEAEAKIMAEASRLTALAIDVRENNPGLAFQLLRLACDTVRNANELAVKTRRDLWNNPAAHPPTLDFIGHSGSVRSVAFSPDGKSVLTGSSDKTAKLWDLNGRQIQAFEGHSRSVNSVAFSPDGKSVLTGSYDYTAKLWDLNGRQIQAFEGHSRSVNSVAFSPDGKSVLTGSSDKTAKLWDASNRDAVYPLQSEEVGYEVWCLMFSPSGDTLLTVRSNYFALFHNHPALENKGWAAPIPLARKDELRIPWTPEEYTQSGDPVRVQEYAYWLVSEAEQIMEVGGGGIGSARIGSEEEYKEKLTQARALYEQLGQGWNVRRIDGLLEEKNND